jgi:hypothetical protein
VPSRGAWLKFFDWSKAYGPIYQTTKVGTVHVWISSEQVAHDLLAKRATIYSDRPTIPNLPDNRTSGEYLALLGRTGLSLFFSCTRRSPNPQAAPLSPTPTLAPNPTPEPKQINTTPQNTQRDPH